MYAMKVKKSFIRYFNNNLIEKKNQSVMSLVEFRN